MPHVNGVLRNQARRALTGLEAMGVFRRSMDFVQWPGRRGGSQSASGNKCSIISIANVFHNVNYNVTILLLVFSEEDTYVSAFGCGWAALRL
jgi:hypothetical protein